MDVMDLKNILIFCEFEDVYLFRDIRYTKCSLLLRVRITIFAEILTKNS